MDSKTLPTFCFSNEFVYKVDSVQDMNIYLLIMAPNAQKTQHQLVTKKTTANTFCNQD